MNTLKQGHGCKKFIEKGSISHFGSEEARQKTRKDKEKTISHFFFPFVSSLALFVFRFPWLNEVSASTVTGKRWTLWTLCLLTITFDGHSSSSPTATDDVGEPGGKRWGEVKLLCKSVKGS